MSRIAVRLIIHGRVQGVGYRYWVCDEARRLQLDGWVRNRRDGTVELVAAGPSEAMNQLLAACRQGPPAAHVTSVDRSDTDDEGLTSFEARPTI